MTRPDLDAIRARCEAATPGPWVYDGDAGYIEMGEAGYAEFKQDWERSVHKQPPLVARMTDTWGDTADDGRFIAAARTDIPALLADIDELEREIAEMRDMLQLLWDEANDEERCAHERAPGMYAHQLSDPCKSAVRRALKGDM